MFIGRAGDFLQPVKVSEFSLICVGLIDSKSCSAVVQTAYKDFVTPTETTCET